MLKKAGIVVAAAAAGLLAVSPLAFAGDMGHHDHSASSSSDNSEQANGIDEERNQVGLVNVNDNNVNAPTQSCGNDTTNTATSTVTDNPASAFLGVAGLANQGGDATSHVECTQGGNAGDSTSQLNNR